MTVKEYLRVYLDSPLLDQSSVEDHITEDSFEEILEDCPCAIQLDDGVVYNDDFSLCAYYHLNEEPEDCFHFIEVLDDEEFFDDDDLDDDDFDDEDF